MARIARTLLVMLIGAILGAGATSYLAWRWAVEKSRVNVSISAGLDAEALARLRLGETDSAIHFLGSKMDSEVLAVSQWDRVTSGSPNRAALPWLMQVKMYRTACASDGPAAASVVEYLKQIPQPPDRGGCQSGVCRLRRRLCAPVAKPVPAQLEFAHPTTSASK